jgi:hypothetical protein
MIIRDLQLIQEEHNRHQKPDRVTGSSGSRSTGIYSENSSAERQKLSIHDREPVQEIAEIPLQHLKAVHETLILLLPFFGKEIFLYTQ